jgi:hypothetical protein
VCQDEALRIAILTPSIETYALNIISTMLLLKEIHEERCDSPCTRSVKLHGPDNMITQRSSLITCPGAHGCRLHYLHYAHPYPRTFHYSHVDRASSTGSCICGDHAQTPSCIAFPKPAVMIHQMPKQQERTPDAGHRRNHSFGDRCLTLRIGKLCRYARCHIHRLVKRSLSQVLISRER